MKHYLLLLMILAGAMSPLFSQKQLPSSIQPYAVHWGYSLKQMFQAAGYEVPGPKQSYDLVPVVQTRSSASELDSTVTYFGYDLNPEDTIPFLKNVYTYPQKDMKVITEYYFDIDHWIELSRTTLIHDHLGRLVDAFAEVYDEETGGFLPDSKIEFHPHEDSPTEADSFFVLGWAPELNSLHRVLAVWNSFNDEDQLIESLTSTEIFELPIVFLDRYYYNPDRELITIESYLVDSGEEFLASREIFFYNEHLVTLSIYSVVDETGGLVDQSKIEYNYTPDGKEELVVSFVMDYENLEWFMHQILGYVYDEQGRITSKEEAEVTDNGNWERQLETYNYKDDLQLALLSEYIYDNLSGEWILQYKTFYYYNETTAYEPIEPVDMNDLFMWPNPASGYVRFELKGEAVISVYNASGQMVRQVEVTDGDMTMDVSLWHPGTYFVRAQNNNKNYSGRLIVQQ